ncbi:MULTISPECIES: SphA family protein [Cupriavidus]|uniref:SphA family protein n=1 Tax=Cupriavidus TaxID=106589 RepID=UPI00049387E9|nr:MULTISPECIES: transporter [Cupriavidus]HBD33748.1 transporter [Cupriavidus sp.]HBO81889.1 transporter [Cupriavidus sp.]
MQKHMAIAALALAGALTGPAARADGHYVPGVEGVQAASVPPPGVYYLGYLVNYNIDDFRAPGTSDNLPGHNRGTVTALANRFVWITPHKLLGADYGMEAIVPVVRTSLTINAAGIADTRSGVGDVYLGPLVLGWHGPQWDAVAAAGMWFDTASTSYPASPGKGFKSTMLTGGLTYYFDGAKTVSGSALMRFERNGKTGAGFRPGNQVTLEWGLGKSFGGWQAGVVGYSQWQTSEDSGPGASTSKASRHALGAELVYPVPGAGLFLKGAFYKELRAEAGTGAQPKGSLLRFTLVKAF